MSGEPSKPSGVAPSAGNGGRGPGYVWTQTLSEAVVVVRVPAGTPGRLVDAAISERHLRVGVKGAAAPVVDGALHAAVLPDECCWTVERDEGAVTVQLDKRDKMAWWPCVIAGHEEIDVAQVAPPNSKLSDLDGETRSMVEKMMYDQRQKAAGLPTSEEQQRAAMFEKFKAQHPEMDFSNAKFS